MLDGVAQFWVLAFSVAITYAGYSMVRDSFASGMVSADSNLPFQLGWVQLVIPITFALSAIHAARCLWLVREGQEPRGREAGRHLTWRSRPCSASS